MPADQPLRASSNSVLALSPDGRSFVYNTEQGLFFRALEALEARLIPGTEGYLTNPFFSPDGSTIGYFDGTTTDQLKRVAVSGGAPVVIANVASEVHVASWSRDDTILFGQPDGIHRVAANGGTPELVIRARDGERLDAPQLLPDGDTVLFSATTGTWDDGQIVAQSLTTLERTVVLDGGSDARYLQTGHLVYARGGDLFGVVFDPDRLAVRGGAVPLAQGLLRALITPGTNYDVANDGTLVYVIGGVGPARRDVVWVDRQGREEPLSLPPRLYVYARLSPDGTRVAVDVRDEQNDIWIWSLARETLTRLTVGPGLDRMPIWSPDGERIAYMTGPNAAGTLVWRPADGSGSAEALTTRLATYFPTAFTPDGQQVVIWSGRSVAVVPVAGERTVTPVIDGVPEVRNGVVAPDGRWIAYESGESGQAEVYVRPFPVTATSRRWQVSRDGGSRPLWSADGRELFYLIEPGRVMAVPVELGETFAYENATEVFDGPYLVSAGNLARTYDVTADGQRFLMIKAVDEAAGGGAQAQIVVVENWTAELERLLPSN